MPAIIADERGYERPSRGDSLAEQVHRQLSQRLLSGAFEPLDRINIRRVAHEIGVSVTPVREAVLRLASDGVLHTTEKFAIIVPERDETEVREIFEIRRRLEGDLAASAAQRMSANDIAFLQKTQDQFVAALTEEDYREMLRCNSLLHFRIYRSADMPIRLKIVESLWLRIGPMLRHMYPFLQRDRSRHRRHEDIIGRARERDAEGLRATVIADLDSSETALMQYLARNTTESRLPVRSSE